MNTSSYVPMPTGLTASQRAHWQRRQQTAQNTLDIQALSGTVASAETMAHFRRYVRGEVSLGQAIEQARQQRAAEQQRGRVYLHRRQPA